MVFLDQYLYFITFGLIVMGIIILNVTKKTTIIVKYQRPIAWVVILIQLEVFIEITIYRIIQGGWFHILMTDLCPLIAFCSIPAFIANNQKVYKILMPWLFVSSLLTILTSGPNFVEEGAEMAINSYLRHTTLLFQGIFCYFWITKYQKHEYIYLIIFPVCALIWVFCCGFIPWQVTGNVQWAVFCTGLLPTAFVEQTITYGNNVTETYGSYAFIGDLGIPYPVSTILFYIVALSCGALIIVVKNKGSTYLLAIKNKWLKIINKGGSY